MNELIDALERAGATVRGKSVRCPFHDDKNPSGVIYQGRDGVWRYRCYVCNWNQGRNWGHVGDVLKADGESQAYIPRAVPVPQTVAPAAVDWEAFMEQYGMGAGAALGPLADTLGVSIKTLTGFGIQRARDEGTYLIPMYDGTEVIELSKSMCGIQYRFTDGRKRCARGSKAGLFISHWFAGSPFVLCVTEGLSDAATAFELDYHAIGCFSASASLDPLCQRLMRGEKRNVVIFADGDDAGERFAENVKRQIARHVWTTTIIRHPPGQDLRSWRPSRETLEAIIHAGE